MGIKREGGLNDGAVAETRRGRVWISTVFLGIDHSFGVGDRPVLFETMIFNCRRLEDWMDRYHTWDEATAGHREAAKVVRTTDVFEAEFAYYWGLIPALPSADWTWRDTLKRLFFVREGGD